MYTPTKRHSWLVAIMVSGETVATFLFFLNLFLHSLPGEQQVIAFKILSYSPILLKYKIYMYMGQFYTIESSYLLILQLEVINGESIELLGTCKHVFYLYQYSIIIFWNFIRFRIMYLCKLMRHLAHWPRSGWPCTCIRLRAVGGDQRLCKPSTRKMPKTL